MKAADIIHSTFKAQWPKEKSVSSIAMWCSYLNLDYEKHKLVPYIFYIYRMQSDMPERMSRRLLLLYVDNTLVTTVSA